MKSENVKYLLNCYLREKFNAPSYDAVDGIYTTEPECRTIPLFHSFTLAGEDIGAYGERLNEMSFLYPENAVAASPPLYNAPLNPEDEALANRFGRRLSQMSDEFEQICTGARCIENQSNAIGNNFVQFKQRCVFVPPNCGNIEIPLVRTGNVDGMAKVAWETVDKTAKSGIHYTSSRGEISFGEGEAEKSIEIEIVRNQNDKNVNFYVKLLNPEGIEIGSDNPLSVYIADHSQFVPAEKQVVENIINCHPNTSVTEVAVCLHDEVTANTFRTALQYTCSYANSIPEELTLAFELVRATMTKARLQTLYSVVSNFFMALPELKDLVEDFN